MTHGITDNELLGEIRSLNLSYLLLVQRLLQADESMAMLRLKIDADMAQALGKAPVSSLAKLANSNQLLCQLSLHNAQTFSQLTDDTLHEDVQRAHAAILLAAQKTSAITPSVVQGRSKQHG